MPRPAVPTFYRPELDALRLAAFLLVFVHHVGLPDAGLSRTIVESCGFGLPLFFFLSAFLITGILHRERQRTGTVSLRRFYMRRILRIWPLYVFALVCGGLLSWRGGGEDGATLAMFAAYATFTADWYFATGTHDWASSLWTPLWSISVEEQFYLLWPVFFLVLGRRGLSLVGLVVVLSAIAVQFRLGTLHADGFTTIWSNPFVQMEFFGVGALVSLLLNGELPRLRLSSRIGLGLFAGVTWLGAAFLTDDPHGRAAASGLMVVLRYQGIAVGCVAALIGVLGIRATPPAFVLDLGRISFGLYVFHLYGMAVADGLLGGTAARVLIGLPLTVLFATLSYRNLEAPFLAMKDRASSRVAAQAGWKDFRARRAA